MAENRGERRYKMAKKILEQIGDEHFTALEGFSILNMVLCNYADAVFDANEVGGGTDLHDKESPNKLSG